MNSEQLQNGTFKQQREENKKGVVSNKSDHNWIEIPLFTNSRFSEANKENPTQQSCRIKHFNLVSLFSPDHDYIFAYCTCDESFVFGLFN